MKKLFNIFLVGASVLTMVYSCNEAEQPLTDNDSSLHFPSEDNGIAYVTVNSGSADYNVPYGVTKAVDSDHNVELEVDQANSTAVLGTDFTLSSSVLPAGSIYGNVKINVKEAAAAAGKKVTFKIKSSTLPTAVFRDKYTVNFSLKCPISSFAGNFEMTETWWWSVGDTFQIVESTAATNQLLVKDFLDTGRDLILNYDPNTFVVTVPAQDTGYFVAQYNGNIWIRPSTVTTQVSSFDPCNRKVTLYVNYYIPGIGSYGNQVEKFSGL